MLIDHAVDEEQAAMIREAGEKIARQQSRRPAGGYYERAEKLGESAEDIIAKALLRFIRGEHLEREAIEWLVGGARVKSNRDKSVLNERLTKRTLAQHWRGPADLFDDVRMPVSTYMWLNSMPQDSGFDGDGELRTRMFNMFPDRWGVDEREWRLRNV